ncbi:four helix bundle protein [Ruminococcus sp.]|jgi:four helix bundle protein|uniref:four helix bundle protein n=1 Tax=Ruminococcus sp. TaxID=41978 RepID=UPI0025EC342B|nr:four helix bundle protein [Ruminococcus sp.]
MNSYRELIVWQKSMQLVKAVYALLETLPKKELFALDSQMRRAVVSIPSNIAEGQGRNTAKEFVHFLSIARGSKFELETQILICIELGYFSSRSAEKSLKLCDEIGEMINSIIVKLNSKTNH